MSLFFRRWKSQAYASFVNTKASISTIHRFDFTTTHYPFCVELLTSKKGPAHKISDDKKRLYVRTVFFVLRLSPHRSHFRQNPSVTLCAVNGWQNATENVLRHLWRTSLLLSMNSYFLRLAVIVCIYFSSFCLNAQASVIPFDPDHVSKPW